MVTKIDKCIVAAVGLAVVVFGLDDETAQAIVALGTALSVFLVPNAEG